MLVTSIYLSCILGVAPPIDCNRNYVDDSIDISQGVSADSNIDGIPDECQDCTDCDGNGMPESIERAAASGLVGQYFSNDGNAGDFRTRVLTRIDSNIDFNWNNGSPDPLERSRRQPPGPAPSTPRPTMAPVCGSMGNYWWTSGFRKVPQLGVARSRCSKVRVMYCEWTIKRRVAGRRRLWSGSQQVNSVW